jgi:D-alanyl-D-alanine carboxypeptidase
MTRRARALGMTRTTFRNASGLPDPQQVTTARDLSILARAVQERFPQHYRLFQTRSFEYAGRQMRTTNRLLGRVEGVDGIKTGYTRASGFNLMTSAKADGRHIVSIVLGGTSGRARDATMARLVVANLPRASTGAGRTLVAQVEADEPAERAPEPRRPPAIAAPAVSAPVVAAAAPAVVPAPLPVARPLSLGQIAPVQQAAIVPASASRFAPAPVQTPPLQVSPVHAAPVSAANVGLAPRGSQPSRMDAPRPPANVDFTSSIVKAATREAELEQRAALRRPAPAIATPAVMSRTQAASVEAKAPAPAAGGGWVIQVGATDNEARARDLLGKARTSSPSVAGAKPFTEPVARGGSTLFRARFGGFQEASAAENACRDLKRSGFACFATRG